MRRTCLRTSLLTLALVSPVGCHQATGPAGGTALTPISPLATPSSAGSGGPQLGPFGSPTRVAPPGTGSYGTPNNYLGGIAPVGATSGYPASSFGADSMAANPSHQDRSMPIGSGVQPASWSETQSLAVNRATANTSPMMPRLGGMRVNDFTQAPPPPGYQQYHAAPWGTMVGQSHSISVGPFGGMAQAGGGSYPALPEPAILQPLNTPPALREMTAAPSNDQTRMADRDLGSWQSPSSTPQQLPSTEPRQLSEPSAANSDVRWRAPSPRY